MHLPTPIVRLASCLLLGASLLLHADAQPVPDAVTADGGHYYGLLVNGMRQGYGRVEWSNGARYEGGFDRGLFSGKGKAQSASGYKYEGNFSQGMMSGPGRMVLKDGSVYEGEFANDDFNGRGRYQMVNGDLYDGAFENGLYHGAGRLSSAGGTYDGQFRQGEYSGKGELHFADGRKYRGDFAHGLFQGKGRLENQAGDVYEGDFDHGELSGTGSYKLASGAHYQGGILKWQAHGAGRFTDGKGTVYDGSFTEGALNGKARMTGKDGTRYEGEFKNWMFNGSGVYRYPNGDVYRGNFARGAFEGEGTLTYAKARNDGRSKDSGIWHYGKLENKDNERQVKLNVETVLYNQRTLLDKAMAALEPQDPKKIDMYMLAVAGDGSQEVFRREVEFVRSRFDREFGTKGRSLALINSRSTVETAPMATMTSIREALKGIARYMDKEQDILFLFLTSHGSKEHEFSLDQNGMDLRSLPAKELGTILKETGIRWKVVLVSACYSGGFIDPVKDDHTLIITAARHDRTSFGCADDNDFTYFGRAFFKESLMSGASFQDAFLKARTLVEKWEAEDIEAEGSDVKEAHSLPQMHNPAPIKSYLQRWQAQLPLVKPKETLATGPIPQAR